MLKEKGDTTLTCQQACDYLRISRPTYLKYLHMGRIKVTKVGRGWRVLKSELDRFLKGDNDNRDELFGNGTPENYTGTPI